MTPEEKAAMHARAAAKLAAIPATPPRPPRKPQIDPRLELYRMNMRRTPEERSEKSRKAVAVRLRLERARKERP